MGDNSILGEDIQDIVQSDFIPWEKLRGKTIFVTGGTGLIGTMLIRGLLAADRDRKLGLRVIALVRDEEKAKTKFANEIRDSLLLIPGCVEKLPDISEKIDYIIHGASNTASKQFIDQPVETIHVSVCGTENVLQLAVKNKVDGFIFLSSMEVYGYPEKGHRVVESEIGSLSPLSVRNCYPLSKILCESMVCAYADEYDVQASIIRLTQTFGPGVDINDNRVFAYFGRCAIERKDIVLKTKGETERSYLYLTDAVTAILVTVLKGEKGQAYNAASEKTYCSIAEMADAVAKKNNIKVKVASNEAVNREYADTLFMNLDTGELKKLGWKERNNSLREMFQRMIASYSK